MNRNLIISLHPFQSLCIIPNRYESELEGRSKKLIFLHTLPGCYNLSPNDGVFKLQCLFFQWRQDVKKNLPKLIINLLVTWSNMKTMQDCITSSSIFYILRVCVLFFLIFCHSQQSTRVRSQWCKRNIKNVKIRENLIKMNIAWH